ncbi:Glycosyltransferase involved in cell wall bisynthesis [Cribrihabitans marinus]|uniref:Glycosyltransferase involved in cell wall bisynthesis n=1 Tax=Cribrihabitans marinus TaxID=1227549 RepID=A0A1H6XJ83_9RHOB|nr:Glycosyltransferase involved in cell wall bisynthesis [Cribrihabitans marinus]
MKRQVVYDLTEVLLASTGRLRYYGIARVVAEIGAELRKRDPSVRFAVFSQGHGELFEVFPKLRDDGSVDLNVPSGIRQLRVRSHFHTKSVLRDLLLVPIRPIVDRRNRRAWQEAGVDLKPIDMNGKTLVSCGRPKLIVDMIGALDRRGTKFEVVPLLHDMIPLHDFEHQLASFPRNFIGDNQVVAGRAKAILANSEFTRDEILAFSQKGILPPVSEVFAVPLVHECPEGIEPPEQTVPDEPYILVVGSSLGRKNLEAVFEALRLLKGQGRPVPTLVLAGARRKKTDKYLQSGHGDAIRDHVVFRENPNQTDLVKLYEGAVALVLASRMEGWGLPAGEALWLGTPAICSTAPVLREVCGDLGLYFDPDRPEELADHVNNLMTRPDFGKQLRARIAEAKPHLRTWSNVAEDLQAALDGLD